MAENKPDKTSILRARYLEAIGAKEAEIKQLRAKLGLLDEVEADLRAVSEPPATNGKLKYSGWPITKAIVDAVQTIGSNGGVTTPEIRKYIEANGYKHPGEYFNQTTRLTLKRLVASGRIDAGKAGDKPVYMAKKTI